MTIDALVEVKEPKPNLKAISLQLREVQEKKDQAVPADLTNLHVPESHPVAIGKKLQDQTEQTRIEAERLAGESDSISLSAADGTPLKHLSANHVSLQFDPVKQRLIVFTDSYTNSVFWNHGSSASNDPNSGELESGKLTLLDVPNLQIVIPADDNRDVVIRPYGYGTGKEPGNGVDCAIYLRKRST